MQKYSYEKLISFVSNIQNIRLLVQEFESK